MAAKPKLTPEEWANVRQAWENDERKGFPWLIEELNLPVSAEAIRLRSKSEGWSKGGKPSLEIKTKLGNGNKPKHVAKSKKEPEFHELVVKNNPAGRPSAYRPEFDDQARKLCLLGATDAELGDFFGVDERTINRWKINYPSFCQSLKDGKEKADAEIADSLFNRAKGYSHIETKVFCQEGQIIEHDVMKHYPPDTGAAFIWLKNRRSNNWRDKIELDANVNVNKLDIVMLDEKFISKMNESYIRQLEILEQRGLKGA